MTSVDVGMGSPSCCCATVVALSNPLREECISVEQVDLARGNALYRTVLLDHGNTIMLRLLLGLSPQET